MTTLRKGQAVYLTPPDTEAVYKVSDRNVVMVERDGKVRGINPGEASVTTVKRGLEHRQTVIVR